MTSNTWGRLWAVVAFSAILAGTGASADELFGSGEFQSYQPDLENGETLFHAAGCASCHAVDGDMDLLAGGREIETSFGEIYVPNITHDMSNGIGDWSNADFLNAVMRGTSPDGDNYYGAVFPFASYALMQPEDVLDIRGYIATLPTADASTGMHDISGLSASILNKWTTERDMFEVASNPQIARGQYLVEAVGHCAECHTPRRSGLGLRYDLRENRAFEGETGIMGYAPNITGAKLEGFGPEAFINAMGAAVNLSGQPMTDGMMRRISQGFGELSVEDRLAMYAYLTDTPIDAGSLDQSQIIDTSTADPIPEPEVAPIEDMTGAHELVAQVNNYCEVQERLAEPELAPQGSAVSPALTAAADQFVESYCRSCHGPGKTNSGVYLTDSLAAMVRDPSIVVPGEPERSSLYTSVENGSMPYGPKPSAEEIQALVDWISALGDEPAPQPVQTPIAEVDYPLFAGGTYEQRMAAIMVDLNNVEPRDQRFIRYISLAAMPLPQIDCAEEGALRNPMHYLHAGVNKFINSISMGTRPVAGVPVAGTNGAVLRIDMRDYRWTAEQWDALTTGGYNGAAARTLFSAEAWDDLLEEQGKRYPYAIDPASDPVLRAISEGTYSSVPVIRADWLLRFGSEAPYYDMFLGLTDQISDLERSLGLDVEYEILAGQMIRAGIGEGSSGVSDHNRMLERFDLPRGGYYWKSYDFAEDFGEQSLTLHPDGPSEYGQTYSGTAPFEHDGGEMLFSLPNGLQGFYLSLANGDRLTIGPTSIVSFRQRQIGKGVEIENARSCFDCHSNGVIMKSDQLREQLMSSNRFSRNQLDRLLEIYIDNDELTALYEQDRALYIGALEQLNATEINNAGNMVSLSAPDAEGGGEIFTYISDLHFEQLTLEQLAREFHIDPETLRSRARQMGDPHMAQLLDDWLYRFDNGLMVHRSEMGEHYANLLGRLTDMRAMRHGQGYVPSGEVASGNVSYEAYADQAVAEVAQYNDAEYQPAETGPSDYVPEEPVVGGLELRIDIPSTEVYVDDLLVFDITASQRCELQIFYVEENEVIEEILPAIVGPAFLEAGETRRIPHQGSGMQIRFDTPGRGETMFAFCRVGGLRDQRMSAADILDYASERSMTPLRGITQEAVAQVEEDRGDSAMSFITFNVYQ